jgi:3-methylfumaryl-CoA hydratase
MSEFIGKTQVLTDLLDPARAAALAATLGRAAPEGVLPPFAHHIHFWDAQPPARLGRDGHPARGGFLPDLGLPRRMWAGGRLEFHAPLRLGEAARKTSTIEAVARKDGRSGPLAFVTLRHDYAQRGATCVTEWQDIVYRQDPAPGAPAPTPPQAPADEDRATPVTFDSTLLFRYSALTFNGHRIHYDRDYCREVEGYGGLVVHGPLQAQMLVLLAEARLGRVARFAFRATAPLLDFEAADFCLRAGAEGVALWVRGPGGRLCMSAEAS